MYTKNFHKKELQEWKDNAKFDKPTLCVCAQLTPKEEGQEAYGLTLMHFI